VHLFNTGSIAQIGEGSVIVSATNDVDDLRKAIIREGFSALEGRKFDELVVRPTRGGEPLTALRAKLSEVKFKCEDDRSLHAYVEVPPKAEAVGEIL